MSSSISTAIGTASRVYSHTLAYDGSLSPATSALSGSSYVDGDGFLQGSRRSGGPYLCALPGYFRLTNKEYNRKTGFAAAANIEQAIQTTRGILQANSIPFKGIEITGRLSRVNPEPDPLPTIVVVTPNLSKNTASWYNVTKLIHQHFSSVYPGISAEIVEESLLDPCQCSPVPRTHSIFPKWEGICTEILSTSNTNGWNMVECWRYGASTNEDENPVTVIISVNKDPYSKRNFYTSIQRIRGTLARFGETDDVAILFLEDKLQDSEHVEEALLPSEACTQSVQPGVSLGIHDCSAGSSTLGGMIELLFGDDKWHPFALTCFHCIFPPDNHRQVLDQLPGSAQAFQTWTHTPVFPGDSMAPKLLQIDHPAVPDIRHAVDDLNAYLEESKNEQFHSIESRLRLMDLGPGDSFVTNGEKKIYERKLRDLASLESAKKNMDKFLEDGAYHLGSVYSGSGVNRRQENVQQPCILDWALIEVCPGRSVGENKPFDYGGPVSRRAKLQALSLDSQPWPETINPDTILFKVGQSTEATQGRYNGLRSVFLVKEYFPHGGVITVGTWEQSVATSSTEPFSKPGDSGALVFSADAKVIGLVLGGCDKKNVTYITPIRAIFEDIKVITGARHVRILQETD